MGNQIPPGHLDVLQNAGAKVAQQPREQAHWIKYETWSCKKKKKKRRYF